MWRVSMRRLLRALRNASAENNGDALAVVLVRVLRR